MENPRSFHQGSSVGLEKVIQKQEARETGFDRGTDGRPRLRDSRQPCCCNWHHVGARFSEYRPLCSLLNLSQPEARAETG